jgi:hypothetical protein
MATAGSTAKNAMPHASRSRIGPDAVLGDLDLQAVVVLVARAPHRQPVQATTIAVLRMRQKVVLATARATTVDHAAVGAVAHREAPAVRAAGPVDRAAPLVE